MENFDGATAHAIRDATIARWCTGGRRIVGRKIGLTSAAVRERLGAPEPTDGYLFADTRVADGGAVNRRSLFQPLAEAEVALILAHDVLTLPEHPTDLRCAIGRAAAAIEIVDSRVEGWRITYNDAIADNGSASGFVLSDEGRPFGDVHEFAWDIMRAGHDVQDAGTVSADVILRDFHWLAGKAIACGAPLRAGEIVLSGSLGGAVPVAAGDTFSARVAGFGACRVSFR